MLVTACVAAFTLLPVYHQFSDGFLLLLTLPWSVTALQRRETIPAATTSLAAESLLRFTLNWTRHLPEHLRGVEGVWEPSSLWGFLTHRTEAIETLVLCMVLTMTLLYENPSPSWNGYRCGK